MVKLRLALVGEKIDYSLSPAIFAEVFRQEGANGEFEVCSVAAAELPKALHRLADAGGRGFSVTIPHKETIIPHLDEIDPVARLIGAVNCVKIDHGELWGYNTDWSGFSHALEPYQGTCKGCPAVVAGTGGAARAVVYALWHDFGVREISLVSRSADNVDMLSRQFEGLSPKLTLSFADDLPGITRGHPAVFNCTPLGGPNFDDRSPFPDNFDWGSLALYGDLNYNVPNRLTALAREAGVPAVDGSRMLVAQALDAFEIWTGRRLNIDTIYRAVFRASYGS